jgi:16S rRNA (uracil1498-N3)-methyltransferase
MECRSLAEGIFVRAIYLEDFNLSESAVDQTLTLEGENTHHLLNVVRIKQNETVLVMNGKGGIGVAAVVETSKKKVSFRIESFKRVNPLLVLDIALGATKKSSTEEIIRLAQEIGLTKLYPLYTQYSQREWPSVERIDKILESAIIQSNNPWKLIVEKPLLWKDVKNIIIENNYAQVYCFSPNFETTETETTETDLNSHSKSLVLIGPEGGFADGEIEHLLEIQNRVNFISLPVPILRTSTAVIMAVGYLLGGMAKRVKI